MNQRTLNLGKLLTFFILSLVSLSTVASAQNKCIPVKGHLTDVVIGPGQTQGTITNGGVLNGTHVGQFTAGGFPTPDPATISYTRNSDITTILGQLRINFIGLFVTDARLITEVGRIDPAMSTGRFAGATGVFYINGKFDPPTANLAITGEICFAGD